MLEPHLITQLAAELQQSEQSRVQVEHFSRRFPGMTIEDGYAVSRAWVAMKLAQGRTVRGHKIGLTSRAMQVSSQISEPDFGTLLDDMEKKHPDWCPVVELKFFAGFTDDETAEALHLPLRTMQRQFSDARRWLFERLNPGCQAKSNTTNA